MPRRRRASAGATAEEAPAPRQTRQPESYLDLHVARKPLARSRSHQGTEEAVEARHDEACAAPELVALETQVTAEVRVEDRTDRALLLLAMLRDELLVQ